MSRRRWAMPIMFVLVAGLAGVGASPPSVDRVSGRITGTYVIVEDTELTGDVTCDVTGAACFSFGASGVTLRLNGFSMTGKADSNTACTGASATGEHAILTNSQNNVTVQGPGLVQRFRGHGVSVSGSTGARVDSIIASTNCSSGVIIQANSFGTLVEGIVSVRNGSPTAPCGGVWIASSHNSRVRLNRIYGNGYADPPDDFGIGVIGTATGNMIDENIVTGNTQGIYVGTLARNTTVRENIVVGNPPIQAANTRPDVRMVDIVNLAPVGETTFDRNTCLSGVNAPCPAVSAPRPPQ